MLVSHRIKPCCVGLKGQCRMVVEEHCEFLHGTYYDSGPENCRLASVIFCNFDIIEFVIARRVRFKYGQVTDNCITKLEVGKLFVLQVNCLEGVCGFSGMGSDSQRKYKPKNANQQWRFPLAIILHPGIIQVS